MLNWKIVKTKRFGIFIYNIVCADTNEVMEEGISKRLAKSIITTANEANDLSKRIEEVTKTLRK